MRVLFTGRGTSGSWQCRGVQLGGEIGTVKAKATIEDMREHDLIVLVKRPAPGQIDAIHKSGKPWVWDVVDFYPQPQCTGWSRDKAINWVRAQIDAFKPQGVIWANERMATDCGGQVADVVLYHHARPGLAVRGVKGPVRVVGYEGSPRYLGRWQKPIEKACKARGMTFKPDGRTDQYDVCVAFRDDTVNGYVQRHWKSNVKLANCHGAGVPFIGYPESGYLETAAGGEVWCDSLEKIGDCLDSLTLDKRIEISQVFQRATYTLERAAADLRVFLNGL